MFNGNMSILKTISENLKLSTTTTPKINEGNHSGRVDINNLLDRARKEKSDERRTSLIYTSLFSLIIIIVVTVLSF
tara:strand:+ start:231 stop:458 length:228 start_codon:yes stop_codon:yes gene_type:complete